MSKALEGVRLVEFSSNMAAAYAAMLLAEQGAEAVLVEPPHGAPSRGSSHFAVLNRSKLSTILDLDSAEGARSARELIARADLVFTGGTESRLKKSGLDYGSIRALNVRAIHVNVPPMGSRGPDADFDADDDLVAARSGITGSQWARTGDPVALTFPASSYSAGILAATAATAALWERGEAGQRVEVSLLAGAFSLQTGSILRHEKMSSVYKGVNDPLGPIPVYRLYEAADSKYLFVACGNATFWGKFAIALERPDLVADSRFENAPWGIPPEQWQTLKDIIGPIMKTRPRDEWLDVLSAADVPCAPVMSRQEFIEDRQVGALGMRRELDDPTLGRTVQIGPPVILHSTPGDIVGPASAINSGDETSIQFVPPAAPYAAGLSRPAKDPSARGPLAGTLVLDFASYIAGSYGPMILEQLGADVIKIESLEGDAFRSFGFGFLGWNQGKRGLALNLNSEEGREIVRSLGEKADFVVENLRAGRMRKFGLDYHTLSARNPGLIYMSVTAFGNHGPDHNQPGFDPILQARSGVMAAQGGHHAHPVYLTCAICDYGAAMLSAFGCVLALRARQVTGKGQFCETSLLQASMAMQAGEFVFFAGRPDLENSAPENRGRSAISRAYQCRSGDWLFVSITKEAQWRAMQSVCPITDATSWERAQSQPSEGKLAESLAGFFADRDRSEALANLRRAGVPATPVNRTPDLFNDPQMIANELLVELPHPDWGQVKQVGIPIKFSSSPGRIERSAPLLGEHTSEILSQLLGYSTEQVRDLEDRGIVRGTRRPRP